MSQPTKGEPLTLDSSVKDQFHALIDAGEYFDSDITQVIGRDNDGSLMFVAVFAKGEDAKALERFLKRQARKDKA